MNFCRNCGGGIGPAAGGTPVAAAPKPTPSAAAASPGDARVGCPHCGSQTPVGFSFCQACGRSLESGPAAASPAPAPVAKTAPPVSAAPAAQAAPPAQAPMPARAPTNHGPDPKPGESALQMSSSPTAPPVDSGAAMKSPRWGGLVQLNPDGTDGTEFRLAGEFVDVGRDAHLCFDDPYLGPRHIRFQFEGASVKLYPLDRLNGVFRRLSKPTPIGTGDSLLLGRELLLLELLTEHERESTSAIQHGVQVFGSPQRLSWGRLLQLMPNALVRDVRYLVGAEIIIGREEGDVVFSDDEFLSRRHASLHWRDGKCVVEDLGSSNGSFVRVREPVRLEHGDVLRIGDQVLRFERKR